MLIENLLIHQLAERASTTIRTIRYYTDEGLLPQPVIQGKYAYYTQNHIDRLELIRRMKDAYLPLREIRQIILSLSDEDVQKRLAEQANYPAKDVPSNARSFPDSGSGEQALEYISRLMDGKSEYRAGTSSANSQPMNSGVKGGQASQGVVAPKVLISVSAGESWQRIPLADGVELHLRHSADPDTSSRVQQLIAFAKKLFP